MFKGKFVVFCSFSAAY